MAVEEISLRERLCRKFCRYYKPAKDESLACMGYLVIEGLSEGGREICFPLTDARPGASVEKLLAGSMCTQCSFYEDGCDFIQGVADASPCGGFVVLGHMLGETALSVDDIEDIIKLMK